MERDCGACHSLAFARAGGTLRSLPHGDPQGVAAALRAFYGAAGAPRTAAGDAGRRVPGLAAEADRAALGAAPRPPAAALVAGAVRAAFSPGGACWDCHTVIPPSAGGLDYRIAPVSLSARFLPRGAFDHGVAEHHQTADGKASCGDCHRARTSDDASDLLLPKIADCAACHGAPAARPAPAAHQASADCGTCHSFHAPSRPAPVPSGSLAPPIPRRIVWTVPHGAVARP
jgi:hypothetical protein